MSISALMTGLATSVRRLTGSSEAMGIAAMTSSLNAIALRSGTDLSVSGTTVTVPAGCYTSNASVTVPADTATEPYIEYTYDSDGYVTTAKLYGFTEIPYGLFAYCEKMTTVDFTESPNLTRIGAYAFYQCKLLELHALPAGLTSIGDHAFYHCEAMDITSLPAGLTSIGTYAFFHCYLIDFPTIPAGITELTPYVFSHCSNLHSLTLIPETVDVVQKNAFEYCNLSTVEIRSASFSATNCFKNNASYIKVWYRSTMVNVTVGTNATTRSVFYGVGTTTANATVYYENSAVYSGQSALHYGGSTGNAICTYYTSVTECPW